VLLDAINQAYETTEKFAGMLGGTLALLLPDSAIASTFLDTFGQPSRITSCECEPPSCPDLAQVLHLVNDEKLHRKVTARTGPVARLLAAKKGDIEIVEVLSLVNLSRRPTAEERQKVKALVAQVPSRQEGLEDLRWMLLNPGEFTLQSLKDRHPRRVCHAAFLCAVAGRAGTDARTGAFPGYDQEAERSRLASS